MIDVHYVPVVLFVPLVHNVHNVIIVPDVLDVSLVLNVLDVFQDIPKFGFSCPL